MNLVNIKHFYNKLSNVTPFKIDMKKVNDFGYMLSCYYELKNNQNYDESFKFSIGFDGYIDNMKCINNYINQGFMTNASFDNNLKKSIVATQRPRVTWQFFHCAFAPNLMPPTCLHSFCTASNGTVSRAGV